MSGNRWERDLTDPEKAALKLLVLAARELSREHPNWTAQQCVARARYLRDHPETAR